MYCNIPWNSLLIQPNGDLNVCCMANSKWNMGHISEIEDLEKHFLDNKKLSEIRKEKEESVNELCGSCFRKSKYSVTRWHSFHNHSILGNIKTDKKIRFLEFTTSNICNQTCATCSSYFSSKWRELDTELSELGFDLETYKGRPVGFSSHGHEVYRLSDQDIQKIEKILPNLSVIHIKGGEPFADDNNYKILKKLLEVNDNCMISLTTNMSHLPEKYTKLLSDYKGKIHVTVSIDGIGDWYEYIRSSNFIKTVDNFHRWYQETGNKPIISTTLSIYNMFGVSELIDFVKDNFYDQIAKHQFGQWIEAPNYLSPSYLLSQEEVDEYYKNLNIDKHDKIKEKNLYNLKSLESIDKIKLRKQFNNYTQYMNFKRNINIYDIFPELKKIQ